MKTNTPDKWKTKMWHHNPTKRFSALGGLVFFLVNRVEHQTLNQTTAGLPCGRVFGVKIGPRKTQALITTNFIIIIIAGVLWGCELNELFERREEKLDELIERKANIMM